MQQKITLNTRKIIAEVQEDGSTEYIYTPGTLDVVCYSLSPAMIIMAFATEKRNQAMAIKARVEANEDRLYNLGRWLGDMQEDGDDSSAEFVAFDAEKQTLLEVLPLQRSNLKYAVEGMAALPDAIPETAATSYQREVIDGSICSEAVLEISTGLTLDKFIDVDGLDEFKRLCEVIKELNTIFLEIFMRRMSAAAQIKN